MSNQDWLSLTEIAQLWSDETGESAEVLERDLDAWFSEFVARAPSQQSGSPDRDGDTTNLLMGLLGGRHLQRGMFAMYCEEKGHAKPCFWFTGDADDKEPDPSLPSDSTSVARLQALHGYANESRSAQSQYEEAWSNPSESQVELAQPASEIGYEASGSTANRPAPSESAAKPESESTTKAPLAPATIWQAVDEISPDPIVRLLTWVRALPRAGGGLPGRKATRLAGGLVLSLSLLAAGFVLGQGGTGRSQSGPNVAGREEFPTALVSSLRSELAAARQTIASLKEEETLETAGSAAEMKRQELTLAAQTASVHAALLDRDLDAAQQRIADLEAKAGAAGVEVAILAKQLAVVRKAHAEALEKIRIETEERAKNLGIPLAPAPSGTAKVTNASISPRNTEVHTAVARPEPTAAAESVDVDSLVTSPGRYEARRVVVTGSLFRLLHQYRLESRLGRKSLVVDVTGIHRAQHDMLQEAIAGTGLISSARAQISGKVVRGSAEAYHLVASDLILLE